MTDADGLKPTKYRQRHKPVDAPGPAIIRSDKQIKDIDGNIAAPFVVRDAVAILERSGKLDQRAADAARKFSEDFAAASLSGYQTADLTRPIGSGGQGSGGPTNAVYGARDRVWNALQCLGGVGSPGASVCWDVLGLGLSIKEHAERTVFGARSLDPRAATGILVGAAHTLSAHYET
tara:strand:- start:358 stop:888 length:531 start_codon:yes stop_codon:yes gene_type:complete